MEDYIKISPCIVEVVVSMLELKLLQDKIRTLGFPTSWYCSVRVRGWCRRGVVEKGNLRALWGGVLFSWWRVRSFDGWGAQQAPRMV